MSRASHVFFAIPCTMSLLRRRPQPTRWAAVAIALAIASSLSACRRDESRPPSLVLITIDHVTADHLACFGGPPESGKALCDLGRGGQLLAWAISPGRGLASSAATVLTGLPEAAHGMDDRGLSFLPNAQTTLAEDLQLRGYRTGAFVMSGALNASRRLDQGFDRYRSHSVGNPDAEQWLLHAIEGFLLEGESPYFAWIHLSHSVDEAAPSKARAEADRRGIAGDLADLDRMIAGLAGVLRRDGQQPAVLLTALRGLPSSIPGIGIASHRIPVIWRPAEAEATRSERRVRFELTSLMDVAPTLARAAGADSILLARLDALPVHAAHGRRIEERRAEGIGSGGAGEERVLLLSDSSAGEAAEVGLATSSHFYIRSRSEFDGTGQPVKSPDLFERSARFVHVSAGDPQSAHLEFSAWREDVLAAESPVPSLEFHLARLLQEQGLP